jgi:hypothetical protein
MAGWIHIRIWRLYTVLFGYSKWYVTFIFEYDGLTLYYSVIKMAI